LDPLYYVVDSTRAGFTGFHESPVWLSLVVTGVVAAVAFVAATHLLARGWRLKP
jgi:ABC-type polysaccharide/polyol phosphate export permease